MKYEDIFESSSPKERQQLILNLIDQYQQLSEFTAVDTAIKPLVFRLLRNDKLLWSQIDDIRNNVFSNN